jgi:hypothetical protein
MLPFAVILAISILERTSPCLSEQHMAQMSTPAKPCDPSHPILSFGSTLQSESHFQPDENRISKC